MVEVSVYYRISQDIETKILITEEEYEKLNNRSPESTDIFFELESRIIKNVKDYIPESIYIDDIGY